MDFHGLYVKEAVEILDQKLKELKNESLVTVIPGQGIHSSKEGPKIKPAFIDYLQKNNYTFIEISNGGAIEIQMKN